MLAIFRTVFVLILSMILCVWGLVYCIFSPRNPCNVAKFSHYFALMAPIFGICMEIRYPQKKLPNHSIYIANHQNNFDLVTTTAAVQPHTVTVGKKSLLWIPLFGLLFWLTGNILIDRDDVIRSHSTLLEIVRSIKKRNISILIFPEGTRSRGRGLLPFKMGAFYIAIACGLPIIPICVSNTTNKIKLNRWYNGLVIVEILSPIETAGYTKGDVRSLTKHCRAIMEARLEQLNQEVERREAASAPCNRS